MNKDIFKELMEKYGFGSLDEVVYLLAENDFNWVKDVTFENEYPSWDVFKKDKDLYNKLRDEHLKEHNIKTEQIQGEYGYEHLEREGGGEGGSEYCYGVFKLKGKIYKAEWSYYSYHGDDYDGIEDTLIEVKPVQVTVTQYEQI